jgi:predicted dehydrogenase
MGKAHTNAFRTIPYIFGPPVPVPELETIVGRREAAVRAAADRFGFRRYAHDWREMLDDERIQVFDNVAPDALHVEPTLSAIRAGRHVICEKPLALKAADARRLADAAQHAGVKHLVCFNYRFLPAVRLAYELLQEGELGEILHAHFRYAQEWRLGPDDEMPSGTGALHIVGSHAIDQARFLIGEIAKVVAITSSPVSQASRRFRGEPVDPDDAVISLLQFATGVSGTLEASLVSAGHRNLLAWEINGTRGTLAWDLESLNVLRVSRACRARTTGRTDVLVCEPEHTLAAPWWPSGHLLGWEHGHVNMLAHFLGAIETDARVEPHGATFEDGARAAEVAAAIEESSVSSSWATVPSPARRAPVR